MDEDIFKCKSHKITEKQWKKDLKNVQVTKQDLDKLVMNYFLVEGYKDAAVKFKEEAGVPINQNDLQNIDPRIKVKQLIQNGEIEEAIKQVQEINSDIFSEQSEIIFELKLQKLIELVKQGKIDEVIEYAQNQLLPMSEQNEQHLQQIEAVMSLLAFEDMEKAPNKQLINHQQRIQLSKQINQEILKGSDCQEKDSKLPTLLKLLVWSQQRLAEKTDFPLIQDLQTPNLVSSREHFKRNNINNLEQGNNNINLNNSYGSIKSDN